MTRQNIPRWMVLLLALMMVLALALAPAMAAPKNPKKPIASKAGQKAALQLAADAVSFSAPSSPTDETKVPHYYGPFPNWANSSFVVPDAIVTIDPPSGPTTFADATAAVDGITGAVTAITVTVGSEGAGYTAPVVEIEAPPLGGMQAYAHAVLASGGSIAEIIVDDGGSGYASAPVVSIVNGTVAEATAMVGGGGAVTDITITNPGSGYTADPVVTIDSTVGTGATATAAITLTSAVTGIVVDTPGSGYTAPTATITDNGGGGADATAIVYGGVSLGTISPDSGGAGYTFPTVDFDMPDGPDGVKATGHAICDGFFPGCSETGPGVITAIVLDFAGSGYSTAPKVFIRNGTQFDPEPPPTTVATATVTLEIQTVALQTFGSGYTDPVVTINDPAGADATATAMTAIGTVSTITVDTPGADYLVGGIKKFQDGLPMLCDPSFPTNPDALPLQCVGTNLGQYLPLAVPDTTTFSALNPTAPTEAPDADYYVIGLVQTRECLNSSLPGCGPGDLSGGTLVREYVQLQTPANASWSKGIPLFNTLLNGDKVAINYPGTQTPVLAVDDPHWLGPVISATKDKPVRIVFYNFLPEGAAGDLFIPKDATIMGSGPGPDSPVEYFEPTDLGLVTADDTVRNPLCTDIPSDENCFQDNRATLHLHGGITPWISDGTPHQWITPAPDTAPAKYTQGASVGDVPDMVFVDPVTGVIGPLTDPITGVVVPDCRATDDGCQTYYYTNQQSARLMFYHDHAWGITRLGVYAGEAAGYLIADDTEQALIAGGVIPADQIPLVIQDRTFVPTADQMAWQDPTWDYSRWGGEGDFWYHHVYMPAQNPGDPTGMSAFGRWMYGPWFWPPATPPYGPIANPYYNMDPATGFATPLATACDLNNPDTWQYDTDPFCEPEMIPGTPNISVGMEQFNDTPIVNGTAYPTHTVEPKAYRLRILNAANDRFFNLQWYPADATYDTEVTLKPDELLAAQVDPNIFPTPVDSSPYDETLPRSAAGPDWIVIGSEGGFLPAPVVVDGQQPTTWIIDPTVFNVGNVDRHSLLVAPAERFDVIVDFSKFAGQTLILYNDGAAAFPARVASYDYYTGAPDLTPVGAPAILPGYGPNTRTVMQVKVSGNIGDVLPEFDLAALENAFRHKADGSGVFESGQHPIIVGQAPYNSAYGTNFVANSYCNGGSTKTSCDGYLRIADQGGTLFGFNTLLNPTGKLEIMVEPKAIHDEMNASTFDEFGRMQANIGVEVVPATAGTQNFVVYPYVNPPTEMFDATNLPENDINPLTMTPISPISSADGTQIWKITHNGVDTHPLHWHLYDVQVLNRVTWDNIVSPPHPTELGWKDTLRVSPLEDTIVALRPIIPDLPWELPNSIRLLHPMTPPGSTMGFNNVDVAGNPTGNIVNQLVNFGMEYVWHCHILSHEEMDMMRPVSVSFPPNPPINPTPPTKVKGKLEVSFTDNSITETSFQLQRTGDGTTWVNVGTPLLSPLDVPNTNSTGDFLTLTGDWVDGVYGYRVAAINTVGYGGEFPSVSSQKASTSVFSGNGVLPIAPSLLALPVVSFGPQALLTWTDNADNENGFVIQRSADGGVTFTQIGTAPASNKTGGTVTFVDTTLLPDNSYIYQVAAVNGRGQSAFAQWQAIVVGSLPLAPTGVVGVNGAPKKPVTAGLSWNVVAGATSYSVLWSDSSTMAPATQVDNVTSSEQIDVKGKARTVYMQVRANNLIGPSAWTPTIPVTVLAE